MGDQWGLFSYTTHSAITIALTGFSKRRRTKNTYQIELKPADSHLVKLYPHAVEDSSAVGLDVHSYVKKNINILLYHIYIYNIQYI